MASRIALTGANGFVGWHLTAAARARGFEVVGIVRSPNASRVVSDAGGEPVQVENFEPSGLARAMEGCQAVVHLAQIGAERGAATYEDVNVRGTERVAGAARQTGVPRLVLFSGLGVAHYGMTRRCTNRYFLSKLAAEVALFRSDREAVVFRPAYIIGPGDGLVFSLLQEMASGEVERPGAGDYRIQPIAVSDAAASALAAIEAPAIGFSRGESPVASPFATERARAVFDLVGPEPVTYQQLLERLGRLAQARGKAAAFRIREIPVEEADRQAAAGGYRGMLPDELDCLLCDEVSDPGPLEKLLGRALTSLDDALQIAVAAAGPRSSSGKP